MSDFRRDFRRHFREERCPEASCLAPLLSIRVCPRQPALHTPEAWASLKPAQRGIFPGLPRGDRS